MASSVLRLLFFLFFFFVSVPGSGSVSVRRELHEPLVPVDWSAPPPPDSSSSSSSTNPPSPPGTFFPDSPSLPTAVVPTPSKHSPPSSSSALIAVASTISAAALFGLCISAALLYRRRRKNNSNANNSNNKNIVINNRRNRSTTNSGSDFLYIGTVAPRRASEEANSSPYQRLSSETENGNEVELRVPSPQLQPLAPLTRQNNNSIARSISPPEEELYYTPQRSVASVSEGSTSSPSSRRSLPSGNGSGNYKEFLPPAPPPPRSRRSSPRMHIPDLNSSDDIKHTNQPVAPPPPPPPPPPPLLLPKFEATSRALPPPSLQRPSSHSMPVELSSPNEPKVTAWSSSRRQLMRLIPPCAAAQVDSPAVMTSAISNGGRSSWSAQQINPDDDNSENGVRPKLKPLHWDKVPASSDRAMVWDQLKSSSFQLNEDIIEALFVNSSTASTSKESSKKPGFVQDRQEDKVLDTKKAQNIAILLRALNVTKDEVAEALLDGNTDGLGPELFETLVKMAPTKEEEVRLRGYAGEISKLGQAERFLKEVLDIPFAFRRIDALSYKTNFETEVNYLRKSFSTLEAGCEELRSSRLFFKLLDAVLKTGNRMNVGTNRGEAKAFKLDTLLKLADVKGSDGKTTILHFVVQEIFRSEGLNSKASTVRENLPEKVEEEFKKQGLKVVSGLSSELGNVKKAAGMDSVVLSSYVTKLAVGLEKIRSVLELERSCSDGKKFFETMEAFLRDAEAEINRVKVEEKQALALVKEITEYFHGDTAKEEVHPLRIFMVVRDFLSMLDKVCKEVGRLQERTMMGSAGSFRVYVNTSFPVFN